MKCRKPFRIISLAALLIILFSLSGTALEGSEPQKKSTKSIAAVPFFRGKFPDDITEPLKCSFSQLCFEDEGLKAGVETTMTGLLQDELQKRFDHQLLPLDTVAEKYEIIRLTSETGTPRELALDLGTQLKADYLVIGNVWRFREKTGDLKGASVAFTIYLFDVQQGSRIWRMTFNKTQNALSDNLLKASDFFRQGVKWLTPKELAQLGIKEALKKMPRLRTPD